MSTLKKYQGPLKEMSKNTLYRIDEEKEVKKKVVVRKQRASWGI